MKERPAPALGPWESLAFGCELALLASLAVAGWRGADLLAARSALMVTLPGLAVAIWAVWVAPASPRRLAAGARAVLELVLFLLAGGALAAVGLPAWGLAVVTISLVDGAVLAARERHTLRKVR